MSKGYVWIAQLSQGFDYDPAASFGVVRPVMMSDGLTDHQVDDALKTFREEFDANNDFLVLTGAPLNIGLVVAAAIAEASCQRGNVRVLVYDKSERRYLLSPRNVSPSMIYNVGEMSQT